MEKITLILHIPKHDLHLLLFTRNSLFYVANTKALGHKYGRNTPYFCDANAPQTRRKHAPCAPQKRPQQARLMPQKYMKDARLTNKNNLQLTVLSEPSPTKIFAIELIVNKVNTSAVVFRLQSVASRLIRNRCGNAVGGHVLSVLINSGATPCLHI